MIIFNIIWIIRLISDNEMKSRHLNRRTDNTVIVNNSSIPKNAFERKELEYLEGNTEEIIIAKKKK